jgi:cytochrome b561
MVTAGLILIQFGLAETWDFFEKPTQHLLVARHQSFGLLLVAVIFSRIAWRLIPGHHVRPADQGWAAIASKSVHGALYALVATEVTLGILIPWTSGKPLIFFGLPIASPMAALSKPAHHLIGEVPNYVAWTIIVLAAGHACAALFHHYVLRDNLLDRMRPVLLSK